MTYEQIKKATLNKKIDVDYYPKEQPYQCHDFIAYVSTRFLGGNTIFCGLTGYVQDYYTQRETNGIKRFTREVKVKNPMTIQLEKGDILVFGKGYDTPLSHVGMFDSPAEDVYINVLGQNQPYPYVTVTKMDIRSLIGVFRPNRLHPKGNYELTKVKTTFTRAYEMNVRNKPSTKNGLVVAYYGANDTKTINFDSYIVTDGYVWGSYISYGGGRRYVAMGVWNGKKVTHFYGNYKRDEKGLPI